MRRYKYTALMLFIVSVAIVVIVATGSWRNG